MNNNGNDKIILVTGGAGFIGTNLAKYYLDKGNTVRIFDNLSREGVEQNLNWLCSKYKEKVQVVIGDVRKEQQVQQAVKGVNKVFHFAAQVAVTTSLVDPIEDFEINVKGTLNVLEAARQEKNITSFGYTSTNKVYGNLEDVDLSLNNSRYHPSNKVIMMKGISEERPLDFHSPYGCSKGASDQYVLDYYRSYNLPSFVFRMSCIYGPFQYGTEDQGWVAHFVIQALQNKPISLYGDGKQVRDILFVEDLVNAFDLASKNIYKTNGHAFNLGGGVRNTVSLLEIIDKIKSFTGRKIEITYNDWRTGDQKYYVSNTNKIETVTQWDQKYNVDDGLKALIAWQIENHIDIKTGKKKNMAIAS